MGKSNVKKTIKLYFKHQWKYPGLVLGALFSVPLTTLINNFLPPIIAARVLDKLASGDFVSGNLRASFGTELILFIILMIFGVLAWRLVDLFNWLLEARVTKDIAHHMYNHLISLDADFHANNFAGSLVTQNNKVIGSYVRITDTTVYGTMPMAWSIIFTSVILASRAPLFVVVFNILIALYIFVAFFLTSNTRKASAEHADNESEQTGALADSVTNIMAIKSFASNKLEEQRYGKYTKKTQKSLYNLMRYIQIQITGFSLFTRILQAAALTTAVVSVVYFDANIATVFLVLTFSNTVSDQLFNFSNNSLRNYNRAFGDASKMVQILDIEPKIKDPIKPAKLVEGNGRIVFDNVAFTHDGNEDALFKDFNVVLKPGEKIGLVGHSGSGKTTLTRLLLRFSDVDEGSVLVDGQDVRDITQNDLNSKIAYVPQEPLLFHRSLRENIAYGRKDVTDKEIMAIARKASAHDFIKNLPDGYDTLVGERGVKLSGGQRQRVAIARAMIKNAPILVLDEATSALDSESEALIQDALWRLMEGKTAIVIAHRLSTIQKMDRIIVLDNGKILEQGSHRELIRKNGKYAELWSRQSGGFIED